MERYYENATRLAAHESQKDHGNVFTFEQVKAKKWPDGRWGDDECNLWSLVREVLDDRDW